MRRTLLRSAILFFCLSLAILYQHAIADNYQYASQSSNAFPEGSINEENDARVSDFKDDNDENYNEQDNDITNPTEPPKESQLFEGDIVLTPKDITKLKKFIKEEGNGESQNMTKRNAIRDRNGLWPTRIIPYELPQYLKARLEAPLKAAIKEYHDKTCLKFVPRTTEYNWIKFTDSYGCWSNVGKQFSPGAQDVSLARGCDSARTVIHELMHAIGFWHEQSRPDRNQYVEILWENIKEGKEGNFEKYSHGFVDILGTNYDFESVMHYSGYEFSKNGLATIRAIKDPNRELGQNLGLSDTDVIKINALYDCKNAGFGIWSAWSELSPCSSSCYKFRQRFCSSLNRAKDCPNANQYGIETDWVECSKEECYAPVDGHWGRWSSWSTCDPACGLGKKKRTRKCNDPPSSNGGKNCIGAEEQSTKCDYKKCSLGTDDCDFENGWCMWRNVNKLWYRQSGRTRSFNTGPTGDESGLKGGHYIYFESSSPVRTGTQGIVESKIFGSTQGTCMSFYFSMHGSTMGSLKVYIQDATTLKMKKVWERSGNQGKLWQNSKITITSSTRFKILFVASKGSGYKSDIALDGITFTRQACFTLNNALA